MDILTSLSFLEKGQEWPPKTQRERLTKYAENRRRFKNKLDFDKAAYDRIINLVGDRIRVVEYRFLINFFKKVSLKTSDLLFVEPPIITAITNKAKPEEKPKSILSFLGKKETSKTKEDQRNDTVETIIDTSDLMNIGAQAAIDASRYGDSILLIIVPESERGSDQPSAYIGIISPSFWFPVSDPMNIKKITEHVIAWTSKAIEDADGKKKEITYLDYQIHRVGKYEQGRKIIKDGKIGDPVPKSAKKETEIVPTGLSDFAIIPAQNVVTSDTIFGLDDYDDFANIVDELQIRVEQNAHILDRHADPSLAGPESALTLDEKTGEKYIKMGEFFNIGSKDDPEMKYITWDGKLDSSFKQIELYFDLIAVLSEMGAAIFDRDTLKGASLSGRALRLLYVNPLTKVRRIRNRFDRSFKKAVSLASEVGFSTEPISTKEVSIIWNDGLPDDEKESAEVGQIRTGGKATSTVVAQIVKQDGLSLEDAEAEYRKIVKETNARLLQDDDVEPFFEEEIEEDE